MQQDGVKSLQSDREKFDCAVPKGSISDIFLPFYTFQGLWHNSQ